MKRYLLIGSFFVLAILLFAFIFKDNRVANTYKKIEVLTQQVREDYKARPSYAGLKKQIHDIFPIMIGDESGEEVSYGAKSFSVILNSVNKKDCQKFLSLDIKSNLSLISIRVNNTELNWGDGLPVLQSDIKKYCDKENIIIFSYN